MNQNPKPLPRFLPALLFLLIIACSTFSCKQDYFTKLRVGVAAPELESMDLDGNAVKLSDYRGQYVYLYFWASWCAPCAKTFPDLMMLNDKFSKLKYEDADAFVFLPISVDDKKDKWVKAIEKWDLKFDTQLCDLKGMPSETSERFQFDKVPASLLINPEGIIIGRDIGFSDLAWELKARLAASQ